MPFPALSGAVARTAHFVGSSSSSTATDGELLGAFVRTRSEAAFADLVRRLGPIVLGVCRRVAGDSHLAEDAFQATFVVLARRAADVRPAEAVRAWLYGVAVRTAREARAVSARRLAREILVPTLPDRASKPVHEPDADALAILDEEVAALPDHLRVAVVLCEIDGLCRRDAAMRLGIPEGTLSSRLAKARKLLATRLRKRGVSLPIAGLAMLTHATVPSRLAAQTSTFISAAAPLPPSVAALSNGVFRTMFLQKLGIGGIATLLLAVSTSLALSAAILTPPRQTAAPKPALLMLAATNEPISAQADPKRAPKGPNQILFYRAGHLTLIDPDGKNDRKVSEDRGNFQPGDAKLSPDGKRLAVLISVAKNATAAVPKAIRPQLFVRGLNEKEPGTDLGIQCQMFFWSPDGTEIACCDFVDGMDKQPEVSHFLVNVKTKEKTALKLPDDHMLTDWSRDGRFFVTTSIKLDKDKPKARLHLMNRDGTEHQALTDEKHVAMFGRLSPDNTRVLFQIVEFPPQNKRDTTWRVISVLDIATGKITKVADVPLNAEVQTYCWSPDGKRIAYSWRQRHEGKPEDLIERETESFLVVCDPDGKNQKTIATEKGQGQWQITIAGVDWR